MKNVCLIFGGKSVEHDVSIISAQVIVKGFKKLEDKYKVYSIYITNTGSWVLFKNFPSIKDIKKKKNSGSNIKILIHPETRQMIIRQGLLKTINIDVCLPIVHGTNVEDGTLQGFLDTLNVPYTGSNVLGSAIGMDKIIMKDILKINGLPIVDYIWLSSEKFELDKHMSIKDIEAKFKYPIFIKPSNLGSSIGITKATNKEELEDGLAVALKYSHKVIIEQGIANVTEINCAVIGYKKVEASLLEEPISLDEFLTFSEKYVGGGKGGSMQGLKNKVKIPAPVSDDLKEKIQKLAKKTFKLLNASGVARIDFLIDGDKAYVNEINTIPGSLQQHLWKASGLPLHELLDKLINIAFEVSEDKNANLTEFESTLLS